jgi:hypothetical protein
MRVRTPRPTPTPTETRTHHDRRHRRPRPRPGPRPPRAQRPPRARSPRPLAPAYGTAPAQEPPFAPQVPCRRLARAMLRQATIVAAGHGTADGGFGHALAGARGEVEVQVGVEGVGGGGRGVVERNSRGARGTMTAQRASTGFARPVAQRARSGAGKVAPLAAGIVFGKAFTAARL